MRQERRTVKGYERPTFSPAKPKPPEPTRPQLPGPSAEPTRPPDDPPEPSASPRSNLTVRLNDDERHTLLTVGRDLGTPEMSLASAVRWLIARYRKDP